MFCKLNFKAILNCPISTLKTKNIRGVVCGKVIL
jgi:hypothetical protein